MFKHPSIRFLSYVLFHGLWLMATLTLAEACLEELLSPYEEQRLEHPATAIDAVLALERALHLVEPALPRLADTNVPSDHPDTASIDFLRDRQLLPDTWSVETFSPSVWRQMLRRLHNWYNLSEPVLLETESLSIFSINQQLAESLADIRDAINPIVLVAAESRRQNELSFVAILLNDSPFPRLVVQRPPEASVDIRSNIRNILPFVSNCALHLENYIYAPSNLAKNLFLANNDSRMYIAATDTQRWANLYSVPAGSELSYLEYEATELENVNTYAALFSGEGPSVMTITRLLTQVRTNMNARDIMRLVRPNN